MSAAADAQLPVSHLRLGTSTVEIYETRGESNGAWPVALSNPKLELDYANSLAGQPGQKLKPRDVSLPMSCC